MQGAPDPVKPIGLPKIIGSQAIAPERGAIGIVLVFLPGLTRKTE